MENGGNGYLRNWWKDLLFFRETWCRTPPSPRLYHLGGKAYFCTLSPVSWYASFLFLHWSINMQKRERSTQRFLDTRWSKTNSASKGLKKKSFSAASGVMIRGKRAGRDRSLDRLRWSLPWEMGPGKGCIWGAESDIKLLCSEANANFLLFLLIKTSFRLHSYQCLSVLEY